MRYRPCFSMRVAPAMRRRSGRISSSLLGILFFFFGLPASCGEPEAPVSLLPESFCLVLFGVPALCRWEIEHHAPSPGPLCMPLLVWEPTLRGEAEDPVIPNPLPIQPSGAPTLCR